MEYMQAHQVSNCCEEYIYSNTDICSQCHEHCEEITLCENCCGENRTNNSGCEICQE